MNKRLLWLVCILLIWNCKGRGLQSSTNDNIHGQLITDQRDFSVQHVYHLDSIYQETLSSLRKEEGMDEVQAAEFLQFMIDRKLLPPPEISFFDSNGERKRKELKYRDFRKYADAIKSKR